MFTRRIAALLLTLLPLTARAADDAPAEDGARRRVGVSALIGRETVSASGTKMGATMYGLDVRVGRQLNDLLGVYVPLHLSFGQFKSLGSVGGVPVGLTGTAAATVVVDATFVDRLFAGGGAGVGVLNNPVGPAIHLRAGGYPIVGRPEPDRRKGLAVAGDLRMIFAKGITATYPTLSVGYEGF